VISGCHEFIIAWRGRILSAEARDATVRTAVHSLRRAVNGSMRVARWAGRNRQR
jgi:hypothetical protein